MQLLRVGNPCILSVYVQQSKGWKEDSDSTAGSYHTHSIGIDIGGNNVHVFLLTEWESCLSLWCFLKKMGKTCVLWGNEGRKIQTNSTRVLNSLSWNVVTSLFVGLQRLADWSPIADLKSILQNIKIKCFNLFMYFVLVPHNGLENKFLTCQTITWQWSKSLHIFIFSKLKHLTHGRCLNGLKMKHICKCFVLRSQQIL